MKNYRYSMIFAGVLSLLVPSSESMALNCTQAPDCASLGYTMSAADCGDKVTVKCPTDASKVFCKKKVDDSVEQADDSCPKGYQKTACSKSAIYKQTDVITTAAGTKCYQCLDCLEYASYLGKTVVYEDDEYHEDLLYKALVSGASDIYVYGLVWISDDAAKACYNVNHTCSLQIHFRPLADLDPICEPYNDGALEGDLYVKTGDRFFDIPSDFNTVDIMESSLLEFNKGGSITNLKGGNAHIRVNTEEISMSNAAVNGKVFFECDKSNLITGPSLGTAWCINQRDQFDCGRCILY